MKKEEIIQIIHNRINFRHKIGESIAKYDGFDMSGYNNSTYSNLELLARFKDLINLNCPEDNRNSVNHFPMFWKGVGRIIKIDSSGKSEIIEDNLGGVGTDEIIFKIITLQNPNLLN